MSAGLRNQVLESTFKSTFLFVRNKQLDIYFFGADLHGDFQDKRSRKERAIILEDIMLFWVVISVIFERCLAKYVEKTTITSITITGHCVEDEFHFKCESGKCIPMYWLCDGVADCPDKDDENHAKCRPKPWGAPDHKFVRGGCPARQFECKDLFGNIRCVLEEWLCDNQQDCADGLDEMYCNINSTTEQSEKETDPVEKQNKIIPSLKMSPQQSTVSSAASRRSCNGNEYECSNGACIAKSSLCNGQKECPDGGDEMFCATTAKVSPVNPSNQQAPVSPSSRSSSLFSSKKASTTGLSPVKSVSHNILALPSLFLPVTQKSKAESASPANIVSTLDTSQTVSAIANKPIRIHFFSHSTKKMPTTSTTQKTL
uniref:Low-density lipoprotein receptor domain class A n=1 Tax=Bursaphelenchus xylophilus TaxID=6326 RepID=A0A1I7SLW3_BURXY